MREPGDVHILIVDDEADVRDFLTDVLEDAGMNVTTAANGDEALDRLRKTIPNLISTDLVMPGKSGIRLIHELRKNPAWSRIPILIVTGHARDRDLRKSLDDVLAGGSLIGPSSCLEKPITPHGYLKTVCGILKVELAPEDQPRSAVHMREEAADLLHQADRETLEAILEQLKNKQDGSSDGKT